MYCQEHHSAHLVYIETEEEQATLQDWLPSSYFYSRAYWIGLQGTSSDDVAWLDGTKPNYTNFAYNSFDGPDGHYFRMKSPEFHWHDQIGTYSDYFICEMEGDVTMTQEPNPELNPSTDGKYIPDDIGIQVDYYFSPPPLIVSPPIPLHAMLFYANSYL